VPCPNSFVFARAAKTIDPEKNILVGRYLSHHLEYRGGKRNTTPFFNQRRTTMGYLIAYLLLALAIDLLRELVNPPTDGSNAAAIRRRLWSDTDFDCCSKGFAVEGKTRRSAVRIPRHRSRSLWPYGKQWFARLGKAQG
jgi:hypothetical protein